MSGIIVTSRDYGRGIWVKKVTFVYGMDNEVRDWGYERPGRLREWQDGDDSDVLVYAQIWVECAWPKKLKE